MGSPWLGLLQTVGVLRVRGVQTVLPGEGCPPMMPHPPAWGPDGAGTLVLGHMPGCGGQDGQPRPHRELRASALGEAVVSGIRQDGRSRATWASSD